MKDLLKELEKLNENIYTDEQSMDEVILRELIADEYTAVRKYEDFANKTKDERVKKVLLSIKREEQVHIGELERILNIRGVFDDNGKTEGAKEVDDLLNEDSDFEDLSPVENKNDCVEHDNSLIKIEKILESIEEKTDLDKLEDYIKNHNNTIEVLQSYLNKYYENEVLTQDEINDGQVRIGKEFSNFADILSDELDIPESKLIQDMFMLIVNLRFDKNLAYHERDMVVAGLSRIFPAYLSKQDASSSEDLNNIVYIDVPNQGQVSWHIKNNELPLFSHLEFRENCWDGHDTVEKYRRLLSYEHGINRYLDQ
jgi:rubrerythrin